MKRLAGLILLACPAVALAAPTPWGGSGSNDLGPAYALLAVADGKVKVKNVQMILACTDTQDGTESSRAFSTRSPNRDTLQANRYAFDFRATSGDRRGRVRIDGVLRSSGRGTFHVRINATAKNDAGAVIERCQGEARFAVRRPD